MLTEYDVQWLGGSLRSFTILWSSWPSSSFSMTVKNLVVPFCLVLLNSIHFVGTTSTGRCFLFLPRLTNSTMVYGFNEPLILVGNQPANTKVINIPQFQYNHTFFLELLLKSLRFMYVCMK